MSIANVLQLVAKFKEAGSVVNKKRNGERPVQNQVEVAVLDHVAIDPTLSTGQLATVGICC